MKEKFKNLSRPTESKLENSSEVRKLLPIWRHKEVLLEAVKKNQYCIIISSTGSGKTTQLPQFLLEGGLLPDRMVAITQPRRVAAISVAVRVAQEMGSGPVGIGPVGYCVRFEDMSDPQRTRLRYMTDGMLLREAILDPDLSRYRYVILDEAHERSLNTDILFGVVLMAARRRQQAWLAWRSARRKPQDGNDLQTSSGSPKPPLPLLKIIVMSATIDPAPFLTFLGSDNTQIVYIEGRPHPIKVLNINDPSSDYVADAATACIQIHKSKTCPLDRGVLIFLTGEEEIMRCCSLIRHFARALKQNGLMAGGPTEPNAVSGESVSTNGEDLNVFPLFASLPQGKQLQAISFTKANCRKVIVSTNLAETSITIPGIRYVIDCGHQKVRCWDNQTGLETFRVQKISKSQAWQRTGRAGREAAGVCLRLYTDAEYQNMPLHPQPELLRAPLTGVLLSLVSMHIKLPQTFPWLSKPKDGAVNAGIRLLERLGAVESSCPASTNDQEHAPNSSTSADTTQLVRPLNLTPLGSLMSAFPLEPRFSHTLISAAYFGCLVEVLSVLSMLYVSPIFYVPVEKREEFGEIQQRFRHPDGDLASLLLVYRAFVKASKCPNGDMHPEESFGSIKTSGGNTRHSWCRANFLNRARLSTAIQVRSQLKRVAKGAGLGSFVHSCGTDLYKITQAFLTSGFRDQVAILADSAILNGSDVSYASQRTHRPIYVRPHEDSATPDNHYFFIHPESQLYLSALSSPPPMLLFIESFTQPKHSLADSDWLPLGNDGAHNIVYMRHVACVKPGLSRSTDRSNFTSWVNQINANKFKVVKKLKSMESKRRSDEDISVVIPLKRTLSDNENEMPQSVHTHSAISSPVLRNSDDAGPSDITSNSPHSVCSTPETRNLVELDHGVVVLTKSQRKRLAKRRKKAALSLSTIQ